MNNFCVHQIDSAAVFFHKHVHLLMGLSKTTDLVHMEVLVEEETNSTAETRMWALYPSLNFKYYFYALLCLMMYAL